MSVCTFCNRQFAGKKTKEHVIPNWFLTDDGVSFNERNQNKIDHNTMVVRDVCANCNNGALSRLDAYGKELYLRYFKNFIFENERISFSFDYQLLIKWLLKISYNSARANNSDPEIIAQYRKSLIDDSPLAEGIITYLATIAPSMRCGDSRCRMARRFEVGSIKPEFFRVGVASYKGIENIYWVNRVVTIGSFRFLLFIPDLAKANLVSDSKQIFERVKAVVPASKAVDESNQLTTPIPYTDFVTDFTMHLENNPIAVKRYGSIYDSDPEQAAKEKSLELLHEEKFDICQFVISREDIEHQNVNEVFEQFFGLISTRESTLKFWGKSEFSILGYDDDPRELFQIPEVREFLKKLDERFPYWLALQSENGSWITVLFLCLNETKLIDGKVHLENTNDELIQRWFQGLNEVSYRFALPVNRNRTQSDLVRKLITEKLN